MANYEIDLTTKQYRSGAGTWYPLPLNASTSDNIDFTRPIGSTPFQLTRIELLTGAIAGAISNGVTPLSPQPCVKGLSGKYHHPMWNVKTTASSGASWTYKFHFEDYKGPVKDYEGPIKNYNEPSFTVDPENGDSLKHDDPDHDDMPPPPPPPNIIVVSCP